MKIVFDSEIFTQKFGGVPRYFTKLAEAIFNQNYNIKIFSQINRNKYLSSLPKGINIGFNVKYLPPKTIKLVQKFNQMLNVFQIDKFSPNIIHQTYYTSPSYSNFNCPKVITVFDMIHELTYSNDPKYQYILKHKKRSINRSDHIICISENTKKDLIEIYNINEKKIDVIYLGYEIFKSIKTCGENLGCNQKPFLLYVGERGDYKNFFGFLKAMTLSKALMRDFSVIAFGGGKFSKSESEEMMKLGFIDEQVIQIDGSDVILAEYFKKAYAFIYPSLYEGFGLPPLEAMANNCPVIVSNNSSLPEVVGKAGEYFCANNLEDINRAINKVVYDDIHKSELIKAGKKQVKKFSWEKCGRETLKIYQKL